MIVKDGIKDYINALEADLPPVLAKLEREALLAAVPIIRKEAQTLLRFLLRMRQPKKILELGTAVGFSGLFMSEFMPDACTLTTVEKVPMRLIEAKNNLSMARKAEQICLIAGDVLAVLQTLNGSRSDGIDEVILWNEKQEECLKPPFDFVFLDAAKAQYMSYFPEIMKLIPASGLLVTDNVLQEGIVAKSRYAVTRRDRTVHMRMREYLYTLTHTEEVETVILPVGDGVALSFKRC